MKNQKLQFWGLLLCCSFVISSCKKESAADQSKSQTELPETGGQSQTYIPVQLKTTKLNTAFSYAADNTLLSIKYDNGDSTQLKFSSTGKPVSIKRYKNKVLVFASMYDTDSKGTIIGAEQFSVSKGSDYVKSGAYTLSYNSDGKIQKVSYFDKADVFLYDQTYSYGTTGNLNAQSSTEATLKAEYLYDSKNALFKNAGYAWLYALEKENPLFLSVINNVEQCTYPGKAANNQVSSYNYNTANFPKSITNTVAGVKETVTIVYK